MSAMLDAVEVFWCQRCGALVRSDYADLHKQIHDRIDRTAVSTPRPWRLP